jgi:hypothetical protein
MSSPLVDHAQRELQLCGQFDEDPAYAQSIVAAVAAFASYGHSGGSAGCAIDQLTRLLQFETLSPLTCDPDEWLDRGELSSRPLWQSARNPQAFSEDGGRTYYLLDEVEQARRAAADAVQRPTHETAPSRRAGSETLTPAVECCRSVNQEAVPTKLGSTCV